MGATRFPLRRIFINPVGGNRRSLNKLMGRVSFCKYLVARTNIYSYVSKTNYYAAAAAAAASPSFNSLSPPFLHFRGQERSVYIPAEPTPSPLPLKANPKKPVEVGSSDRDVRPAMNAPTTNAFQGISGNLETKSEVEETGATLMKTTKHTEKMEWRTMIKSGDVININDLLFTKKRDYLIRYNDNRRVKAGELANKLIVVYLVPLLAGFLRERMATTHLIDTYNYLLPHNVLEIVLVAYETDKTLGSNINPEKQFESLFSLMPWTAIPFSDIASRDCLSRRFGIRLSGSKPDTFVIDSTGVVLQDRCLYLFEEYGGLGYPFTDERIQFLESQDAALAERPSLKMLLASPEHDYVISNKGDKVPIDTLEEKVVALYFYEEGKTLSRLTAYIELAYEEFAKKKKEFEVVLIYLYDTESTCGYTNEESFCRTFKSMPWLALPFKDPAYKKLKRFFGYNLDLGERVETPSLVIFGPYGKFIEPWGADILMTFKLPAYPFTREKVAKLETEKIKGLKLEMLWDQKTSFRRNEGTEVKLHELVGKRIILFFEGKYYQKHSAGFLNVLKNSYSRLKGTDDEFEVIYITTNKGVALYEEMIFDVPWLFAHESELLPIDLSLYCCYCLPSKFLCHHPPGWCGKSSSLLVFDRDGKIVSKLVHLSSNAEIPFSDADMEKMALFELNNQHEWFDLDQQYRGLAKKYFQIFNLIKLLHFY